MNDERCPAESATSIFFRVLRESIGTKSGVGQLSKGLSCDVAVAASQLSDAQRYGGCQQEMAVLSSKFCSKKNCSWQSGLELLLTAAVTISWFKDIQSTQLLANSHRLRPSKQSASWTPNMVNIPVPFPLQSKLLSCYACRAIPSASLVSWFIQNISQYLNSTATFKL